MKKTLALALAAGFAAQTFAADGVLVLATDGTYPPFSEMDSSGKLTGYAGGLDKKAFLLKLEAGEKIE